LAKKKNKKLTKREVKTKNVNVAPTPIWFDQKIHDEDLSKEEEEELKKLLKEFN